ncbi:type III pantothenate kinase [Fulvitalea axinellae]|uniref:Type III pantothenate kinase n=1 Tax=Fulvitalea axinellae TaxID=1182444 RepID=A0AAU9C701_9BACT|nr:type III pantothenate kinase [Fulvitalea axinellae]
MNLCIDIGNTRTKAGLFSNGELVRVITLKKELITQTVKDLNPKKIIFSSVSSETEPLVKSVSEVAPVWTLHHAMPLPFRIAYKTPETLGVDRIAGVAGARHLTDKPALVIDIGTCVTYDIVDAEGTYHGGSISPGLRMRLRAMNHFTERLPLIETGDRVPLTGSTTEDALRSGATHGLRLEIEGIIREYRKKFRDLAVILCGGDSEFFELETESPVMVKPELVLIGLNSILSHNVEANV